LWEFSINNTCSTGVGSRCKQCNNEDYRKKHPKIQKPKPKEKHCPKCGRTLPLEKFYLVNNTQYSGYCKECRKVVDRESYKRNAKERREKQKAYYENNKKKHRAKFENEYNNNPDFRNKIKEINKKSYFKNRNKYSKIRKLRYHSLAKFEDYKNKLMPEDCAKCGSLGELLVKCKHCGKFYTPTRGICSQRIRSATKINSGFVNFYCSDKCKADCDVFGMKIKRKSDKTKERRIRSCQNTSRKYLMELQEDNEGYTHCDRCGKATEKLFLHHVLEVSNFLWESHNPSSFMLLCSACHTELHSQCK
jgi:uncharacterized OB-fold protein